jgi:4-diphosphocytidyl-2-C-methyl-D-erythritol kinase
VRLQALAPAKVNLGLFVGGAREGDGRHQLVTVFQALSLADTLTGDVLEAGPDQVICPGVAGENLATRALAALRARGWDGPPLRIEIDKRIPVAGGMAGGSADAAAALRIALALLPGRAEEVEAIAAELGADVPSQLMPGVSLGTGAGELVEQFSALPEHAFVVVPVDFQLSTAAVFREADRLGALRSADELEALRGRIVSLLSAGEGPPGELLINDLEPAARSLAPALGEVLEAVLAVGAEQAFVSGSGPTVCGLWWGGDAALAAGEAAARLRDRFPAALSATPVKPEFALPTMIA